MSGDKGVAPDEGRDTLSERGRVSGDVGRSEPRGDDPDCWLDSSVSPRILCTCRYSGVEGPDEGASDMREMRREG